MWQELRRLWYYKRYYSLDFISAILSEVIFVSGLFYVLGKQAQFVEITLLYSFGRGMIQVNQDLELDIRLRILSTIEAYCKQYLVVYVQRYLLSVCWHILIIVMVGLLMQRELSGDLSVLAIVVHSCLCMILYSLSIRLTLKHERTSVFLQCCYMAAIRYSGMVFPVGFYSYRDLLVQIGAF